MNFIENSEVLSVFTCLVVVYSKVDDVQIVSDGYDAETELK